MPFTVALTAALALAVFVVLPFYANGLQHLPLEEVSGGAHDPKDLWPVTGGSALAGLFRLAGMLTLVTAPFVAVGCALHGGYAVWRHRADRSVSRSRSRLGRGLPGHPTTGHGTQEGPPLRNTWGRKEGVLVPSDH
jgi:hypothetical protein